MKIPAGRALHRIMALKEDELNADGMPVLGGERGDVAGVGCVLIMASNKNGEGVIGEQ